MMSQSSNNQRVPYDQTTVPTLNGGFSDVLSELDDCSSNINENGTRDNKHVEKVLLKYKHFPPETSEEKYLSSKRIQSPVRSNTSSKDSTMQSIDNSVSVSSSLSNRVFFSYDMDDPKFTSSTAKKISGKSSDKSSRKSPVMSGIDSPCRAHPIIIISSPKDSLVPVADSLPEVKAAEMHQTLLKIRLQVNSLQLERQQLNEELERSKMKRENLLLNVQEAKPVLHDDAQPTKLQILESLKTRMGMETARTSTLLQKAALLKEALFPEALQRQIKNIQLESAISKHSCAELRTKSTEIQIATLVDFIEEGIGKENDDSKQNEILENSYKSAIGNLLEEKDRLSQIYSTQVTKETVRLSEKRQQLIELGEISVLTQLVSSEEEHRTQMKVLQFGLEERQKQIKEFQATSTVLEDKLNSLELNAQQEALSRVQTHFKLVQHHHKTLQGFYEQLTDQLSELKSLTPAIVTRPLLNVDDLNEKIKTLKVKIAETNKETTRIDNEPPLRARKLEAAILNLKTVIKNSEEQCQVIKAEIRAKHQTLKGLPNHETELSVRVKKLDELNQQLSEVYKRLEEAEDVKFRTAKVLSRQKMRVGEVQGKLSQVEKMYSKERNQKLERVIELEKEKEEIEQRFLQMKNTLARLHRQAVFGGKKTFRSKEKSFDFDKDSDDEVDLGKRTAFFCQEIKRLQQHSTWLQESLDAVRSASLTPTRLNAVKKMLKTNRDKANVQRRPNVDQKSRPVSMSAADMHVRRRKERSTVEITDNRRRTVHLGSASGLGYPQNNHAQSTPLIRRPKIETNPLAVSTASSCFQRRWAFSQSLREKRTPPVVAPRTVQRASFRLNSTNQNQHFMPSRCTKTLPRSHRNLEDGDVIHHKRPTILSSE